MTGGIMKLKIKYEMDNEYNVTEIEIWPNRNPVETANVLTAALTVVLSKSLDIG